MPPPPEVFASRLFLGPALRAQPDRRLVTLVREGYEAGFEEIVRRYGRPLARYAASIVGSRSEDVTQDAFSKALTAMRRDDNEIDLRPWLYRIVRNTALNDLRDRPPTAEILEEAIAARRGTAAEVEQREELRELIDRLQALPERQRAAIVMRELEGLSHEEIAAALGLSGGAARQVIFRAREALRSGAGLLVPLPLMRLLLEYGQEATASAGLLAAGGAAGGAGTALKAGAVAVIIAGSVGTGLALQQNHGQEGTADAAIIEGGRRSDDASGAAHPSAGGSPGAKAAGESEGGGREQRGDGSGAADGQGRGGSGNRNGIRAGAHSGPPGSGGGGGGSVGTGPSRSGSGGSRNSGPGSGGSISGPVGGEHAESGDRNGGSTGGSDDSGGPSGSSGSSGGGSDDSSGPGGGISSGSDATDSHSGSGSDGTDGGSATTEPAPATDGSTGSSDSSGTGSSDGSSGDVVSGSELSRSGPDGGGDSTPPPSS
jgi:RNA polymerase sigma factor (sigma-70 family)